MKTIDPQRRLAWDALCFVAVVVSAFTIPYDLMVGWENPVTEIWWDILFLIVFGVDMVVNAMTARRRSFAGLWGWRNIAGLFWRPLSAKAKQRRERVPDTVFTKQPAVMLAYLTSGWFLIDLMATMPWGLLASSAAVLGSARLLRLLRLARLARLLRLAKGLRFFDRIGIVTKSFPAVRRMFLSLLMLPWLAHVHACLLFYAESGNPTTQVTTYRMALHSVFVTFTTSNQAKAITPLGFWIGISAVCISVLVIGMLFGNIAALFTALDIKKERIHKEVRVKHTIVLGWHNTIYSVVDQLSLEQEGRAGDTVILADLPSDQMWQEISENCSHVEAGKLDIIKGSISSVKNIRDLQIDAARQVIVLGYDREDVEQSPGMASAASQKGSVIPDIHALKALLACCHALNPSEASEAGIGGPKRKIPIVVAVRSAAAAVVMDRGIPANLRHAIDLHVVDTSDFLVRCITQVVNEPLMARVYHELFSYEGNVLPGGEDISSEIYTAGVDELGVAGLTCEQVLLGCETAVPIGYFGREGLVLNPGRGTESAGHELELTDRVVAVANERAHMLWDDRSQKETADPSLSDCIREPKQVLVLGSGPKSSKILDHLPEYLPVGSTVLTDQNVTGLPSGEHQYRRVTLGKAMDVLLDQRQIEAEVATGADVLTADDVCRCDTVVILADLTDRRSHDAHVLMTLTAVYAMVADHEELPVIVIELLDYRNFELAQAFGNPLAIVSADLVSNFLVQLAREPDRGEVFKELLDRRGNEIYMRPAEAYFGPDDRALSFDDIRLRARARNEIAVGYCPLDNQPLQLCPLGKFRTDKLAAQEFNRIVVVAEE